MSDTPKEPTSFNIIGTLVAAGVLSGLILVVSYLATRPLILANQAAALQAAVFRVLPGAEKTEPFELVGGKLQPYKGAAGTLSANPMAFSGLAKDGSLIGYAMPAEGAGFMDTIKLLYGYDPKTRRMVGMEVLDSKETPGLGDKILSDQDFLGNFKALTVEPTIVPLKKGEKSKPNEIDCITGATISSKAIVKILNASTQQWLPHLKAAPATASK